MSRSANYFAELEFYHLYNRGVDKRKVFNDDNDRKRFIMLLYICNSDEVVHLSNLRSLQSDEVLKLPRGDTLIDIGAYCLMPNHFHLLVKEKKNGGLSKFMQKISTAYVMYYNQKYERSGVLFQGVFKAEHCDSDNYLKYLFAYIHLNPIKMIQPDWKDVGIRSLRKAEEFLLKYKYSSYLDYLDHKRLENKIISPSEFPIYFETAPRFSCFIKDWLSYQKTIKAKP